LNGVATETAPMRMRRGGWNKWQRASGAIAWKLLLAVVAGVGAIWIAAQSSIAPSEPASREVAGPIAIRTPVPNTEIPLTPAPVAARAETQNDPFAGVDVSNNSVLRHIAGIEEKARGRQPTRTPETSRATPAPIAAQPERVPAAPPVRAEAGNEQKAPPSIPTQIAAAPPAEATRAPIALQTAAPADALVTRSGGDAVAASPGTAVPAPPATPANNTDRVLVAALGANAPVPSTFAPLRVITRTVPAFPQEALRDGIRQGRVVARLTIEADGRVSGAQIISAAPLGYFERESRRALATWRYEPPGSATSADVELVFNRE
jgi:protein TonB